VRAALLLIFAYLLGSIPFGYLIVRARAGADIRETGSGGTGATNVSRKAGKVAGVLTLVLDALKGATAVVAARLILAVSLLDASENSAFADWWIAIAAILVIIGHMFPIWLGFRGGKGVATGVGVFLVLAPFAVVAAGIIFVLIVILTRYVSLGSIVAASTIPLFIWLQHGLITPVAEFWPSLIAAFFITTLIIFAHRGNIRRLVNRTESKFS
jgi:acyl phosphate:glycerol-3-phosphate acyltransferase